MNKPILFLDIDGVMNTTTSCALNRSNAIFVGEAVDALRATVSETGCDVVISSTWRETRMQLVKSALDLHGLDLVANRIIGATPVLDSADEPKREDEIDQWLHENPFSGRMAILDDEPCGGLRIWQVLVREDAGLTNADAAKAIRLLQIGPPYKNRTV